MREVVKTFTTARLLVTNTVAGVSTVEVSHEALMREWKLLADWIHEAREDIQLRKAISEDAAEWKRRGCPNDRLYRGSQLSEALAWRERNSPSIDEDAFLSASIAERERQKTAEQERQTQEEQQRKKITRRTVLVGLAGLGLTIATVAVSGYFLSRKQILLEVRQWWSFHQKVFPIVIKAIVMQWRVWRGRRMGSDWPQRAGIRQCRCGKPAVGPLCSLIQATVVMC